jgi:hypothetical protein
MIVRGVRGGPWGFESPFGTIETGREGFCEETVRPANKVQTIIQRMRAGVSPPVGGTVR